ncbi:MAG: protein TolQ [Phenylobacterium sp.]|uniref:protein TolQ n=1 Tax=Phenylobacterium sp. TaxID=1871053 RepID=UPI0011FDE185|nr:protein TolQ [Phenylobacterium sp.]TAL34698.1 MAG: protein TolQ [Phenylobacterium sp.]
MDPAAITPQSFDLLSIFLNSDWVVKLVMIGLAASSLWSWTIILDKLFRFHRLNREADKFEDAVSSGRSLEDVAAEAGERPTHPLPRMLQGAMKEWRETRAKGAVSEGQVAFLIQRIDRQMDTIIARESARVENGLGILAIVATASPFVGLFGTVWGIMRSFQAIAIQKNTSLAIVAPSIAEALFATAIGLVAAIPAYIAFNAFSTSAGKYSARLEGFADDLSTAIQRRLAERG